MTRTRNAFMVPLWIAVVAAALLALVLHAQPVLAPVDVLRPSVTNPETQPVPSANAGASRSITASPVPAVPPPATRQPASTEPAASPPAQCPTQSGSGLPCQLP